MLQGTECEGDTPIVRPSQHSIGARRMWSSPDHRARRASARARAPYSWNRKQVPVLTLEEKAWLSAAIDGEGTILVIPPKDGRSVSFSILVYNSNLEFVEKAGRLMGATVGSHLPGYDYPGKKTLLFNPPKNGPKRMFRARLGRRASIVSLVEQLLPHLIIKRDKALELLRLNVDIPPKSLHEARKRGWKERQAIGQEVKKQ